MNKVNQLGYVYGVQNRKGGKILEFCAAMNMTVGTTLFKKRENHLVTYESGPSKTQVGHCLVGLRRNQKKFLKDITVLPSE